MKSVNDINHLITETKSAGSQKENLNVEFICKSKTQKRKTMNKKIEVHQEKNPYQAQSPNV